MTEFKRRRAKSSLLDCVNFVGLLRPVAKPGTEAFRESEGEKASRIQVFVNLVTLSR